MNYDSSEKPRKYNRVVKKNFEHQLVKSNPTKKPDIKTSKDGSLSEKFWGELRNRRTFHEGQEALFKAFFQEGNKKIFNRTGRKGAKTTANITCAWGYSLAGKNRITYITLPTRELADEVYWEEKRIHRCDLPDEDLQDMFVKDVSESKRTITFINGSTIKLIGTWSEARARGQQPDLLIPDEIQDCSPNWLEAMDSNLAAKPDARYIMSGTPPRKRNHYHEWEERTRASKEGVCFHYSSYVNTCLPHLKDWLDNKKIELYAAGKEDVWLREYMAEDCFSSDERVLPDIELIEHEELIRTMQAVDPTAFQPLVAICMWLDKVSTCYAVCLPSRYTGLNLSILETETTSRLWDHSHTAIYSHIQEKMSEYGKIFRKSWKEVVYDETESFTDVITHIPQARKDFKWKQRGTPLLKELILNKNMTFSTRSDQFGMESQNLLKEDDIREYPTVCTMAMLANEFYESPTLQKDEQMVWDQFAPLREAGIVCKPPKKGNSVWSVNWD